MKEFETVEQQPWNKFNKEIKKIYIEDGVKTIGKNAFTSHSMLSSILIPNNIASIGLNAFDGCKELTTVQYEGTKVSREKIRFPGKMPIVSR